MSGLFQTLPIIRRFKVAAMYITAVIVFECRTRFMFITSVSSSSLSESSNLALLTHQVAQNVLLKSPLHWYARCLYISNPNYLHFFRCSRPRSFYQGETLDLPMVDGMWHKDLTQQETSSRTYSTCSGTEAL